MKKLSTIFQAEVYAIDARVKLEGRQQLARKIIKIFSDSQLALKALEYTRSNS